MDTSETDGTTGTGETYRCDACGEVFETERELEDHVHSIGIVY